MSKYEEGYQTGLTWDRPWTPGGPFVYTVGYGSSEKTLAMERQSKQDHADWMQGWRDGKAKKDSMEES